MGKSTVTGEELQGMIASNPKDEQKKEEIVPKAVIFDYKVLLKGEEDLGINQVDDLQKFKILENQTAVDMLQTKALVKTFVEHCWDTDQLAALSAIERKVRMRKAYQEALLARQKAELEDFDRIRADLILHIISQVQEALAAVLETTSISSELKESIMRLLREKLSTIELDTTLKEEEKAK